MKIGSTFYERRGSHVFRAPRGYLPQINEWAKNAMTWKVERHGGREHIPIFLATPICEFLAMYLSLYPLKIYIP